MWITWAIVSGYDCDHIYNTNTNKKLVIVPTKPLNKSLFLLTPVAQALGYCDYHAKIKNINQTACSIKN